MARRVWAALTLALAAAALAAPAQACTASEDGERCGALRSFSGPLAPAQYYAGCQPVRAVLAMPCRPAAPWPFCRTAGARLSVECKDSLTDTVKYNGQDVAWSAFVDGLAFENTITEASFLLDGVTLSKGADVIAILDVGGAALRVLPTAACVSALAVFQE